MRVLVSYGTKQCGTEAMARTVANGLVEAGHAVDVMASTQVDALDRWDAVVVGGTPYAWCWHRSSQRFIKRSVQDLLYPQPPFDIRLIEVQPAPPPLALQGPGATSVPPLEAPAPAAPRARGIGKLSIGVHWLVSWLCLFTGVTAAVGGAALVFDTRREGSVWSGLVFFFVVGLGNLVAAGLEAGRVARSELAVAVAGAALTGWSLMQWAMRGSLTWPQLGYFVVGVSTVVSAIWLWRARLLQRGSALA